MADASGAADEVEAAIERLFGDAWREAGRVADDPVVTLGDPAVQVTCGDLDELDAPLAVRSASVMVDRQLLVRGPWLDVVLDLAESGEQVDVRGMVVGVDEPCAVQLLDERGDEVALDVTDELGEFALLGVAPDHYELVVAGPRGEVSVSLDLS